MRNIRRLHVLPEITLFGRKVTNFIPFHQIKFAKTLKNRYLSSKTTSPLREKQNNNCQKCGKNGHF